MTDGGKGSRQRPLVVPMSDFDKSWDEIFGKKQEKDSNLNVTIKADQDEEEVTVTKTWSF